MVDPNLIRSPFEGHHTGEHPNRNAQIGLQVTAQRCASVTLISTWVSGVDSLQAALADTLKIVVPQRSGQCEHTDTGLLMRTGPEEFLWVTDEESDNTLVLRKTITAEIGSVTDLSHARCRIQMKGPQCNTILNKLFALDLRITQFPIEELRMTGTHHVPSLLHRRAADQYDWYVFTTYAYDQLATLLDAAQEYGYSLR